MNQTVRIDSLISSPSASFEQPFDMLHACHERMQRMLALLQHHRDEELHVFPLLAHGVPATQDLVGRLQQDRPPWRCFTPRRCRRWAGKWRTGAKRPVFSNSGMSLKGGDARLFGGGLIGLKGAV